MGIFNNLTTEGLEETQDRLGGFSQPDTDIYEATIKAAYAGESQHGAKSVTIHADIGGREFRETIYITNRAGENFFLNKQDKTKKVPLPGFTTVDHLCLVTTDSPLAAQETEDKVINLWDNDAKKEMPKSVPMLTALTGKKVYLGIVQSLVNKNEKDSSGNYVPTPETRVEANIDKIFHHPTKLTVVEAENGSTEPKFYDAWLAKNQGVQRDRRELKDGGGSGRPVAGAPSSGNAAPKKSLFEKNG